MKVREIVEVYGAIAGARTTGMDAESTWSMVTNAMRLEPLASEFQKFKEELMRSSMPEGYIELVEKMNAGKLDEDESRVLAEYLNTTGKALAIEQDKECDVELDRISEEQFKIFVSSNEFTIYQSIRLRKLFV